jgi:fibronectin type 3 domain-containing protein
MLIASLALPATASAADPVIAAAGDISCNSTTVQSDRCHQKATSDLIVNAGLSAVLTLGDAQYQDGGFSDFMNYYDKSWGRVKSITYPAVGNHEYQTSGATGYFDYFNGVGNATGRAGDRSKGYYSFDIGTWHLISLNSNDQCTIVSCSAGSAQETWLKADLAAHTNYCTLAYWHHPSFNSGNGGNLTAMQPELTDLYNADADVILGGHAHHYERFAPQNPSGQLDNARGIRQFIVGTGGAFWTSIGSVKANSQVRQNTTYGVLKLTLHPTSYDWQFVPEAGGSFTDSGTGSCHGAAGPPPDTTKPTAPGNLTATAGAGQVTLNWQASTDNVGVTGYRILRGAQQINTVSGTTTSYTDTGLAAGPYSYTVRAVDAATNLSDPSNTATATVPDTTKPTAPGSLTATPGAGKVDLSWQASTDNLGVTGYRILRGAQQINTVSGTTTSYTDTGLAAGPYSYTVRAVDAATNLSDPSNTATATVPDTTKPTAPGNLHASGGTGQVALDWRASSDDVGVTGYRIFRGTQQIDAVSGTTTSYTDQGLSPGTYGYQVKAVDAAGNVSDPSNTASGTVPDETKPTAPQSLVANRNGPFQVDLTWQASTDNVAVTGYDVYRDGQQIATTGPETSYSDTALIPGTYKYEVRAFDAAGNVSDASNTATVTLLAPDQEKPTAPGNLVASLNGTGVDLTWEASTDNVGVIGYQVYRDGALLDTIGPATSYSDTAVPAGDHAYEVRAVDGAGNRSDPSNTANVTVPDTQKPTPPENLKATAVGSSKVDLTWQGSTDDVGVTGYDVYRNGALLESIGPATAYSDTSVTPGPYSYELYARDAAGNVSDASNDASVTVEPPDTEKPTAPGNLSAASHGSFKADLAWQASSDNKAVTSYDIYRDGALLTSIDPATEYSDASVVPGGTYVYEVHALDAALNDSGPSNTATVTIDPLDTQKPTAPQNLTAVLSGTSRVDLSWQASTDNVGVAGYNVFRNGSLVGTPGATTTYSDGPRPAGNYHYEVRALDAAGNESDSSNTATITVPDSQKPTAPGNLTATAVATDQIDLSWQGSTDDVGVTGYKVYRGTTEIASVGTGATSYSDSGLAPGTHSYTVTAVDAAGNVSDPSNAASATLADSQKPTAPQNLTANLNGTTRVDLAWQTSSDNVGVTGYRVFRGATQVAGLSGTTTSYTDTPPGAGSYGYTVTAVDAAGNVSGASNTASATIPDTERPTSPTNLTATVTGAQVDLRWQASSDNVAVTKYRVYRGSIRLATLPAGTTTYTDSGRPAGTYRYTIQAMDAAGNLSYPSNAATVTVSDTQKPTAPQNLTASLNGSSVSLTWQAASDNVGVTGYQLFRGSTQIAALNGATTSYMDTPPGAGSYQYTVNAIDAAGNISDASNTASATLPSPPAVLTLSPDADARALQSSPTSNYGTDGTIGADFSTGTSNIEAFLRFTVSGVAPGSVLSAKLRLHSTSDGTADGPAIYTTSPSWSETTVSWNTRPAPTSPATDDKGAIPANTWVEYNVTPFVTGNGTYSFRLATTSTDGVYFSSREAAGFQPELVINTGTPDTAKPSAPGNLTANAGGPTRIDLSWLASTDNIGVTGYNVYRGGTLLAGIGSTTSYADSSVGPNTTYSYQVRALDLAGNSSDPSNSATATTPAAPPPPTVQTIAPEADARVQQSSVTTNYGTSYLRADGGTDPGVESFLRFTVAGVTPGTVQGAKLRLYAYSGTVDGPAVFSTSPSWDETTVNWDTRPTATSSATDKKGSISTNSWVEYDVTPLVTGNGTYSFRLATTSTDGVDFYSRENATLRPELVVTSQ